MNPNLPSGTVTFLFTDIEGSTRLAQQYPDHMPALLARHNEILDRSIRASNGFLFRIVGDSFAVAFQTAGEALKAALEAQRGLQAEAWSPAEIKVRMGIHTGAAQLEVKAGDPDYSGYATLALTQRIMSAAHGGQILLSQTAHDLTLDRLPAGAAFADMGECRLKDVERPQHLYQLTVPDLPSEFAPLNTLETIKHNLPAQLTSFIGREKEVEEVERLIGADRMVTLTGSGGAGKTRLSLQVAGECLNQFPGGAWFVELAPVSDPTLVPETLLGTLSLREDGRRSPIKILTDYLHAKTVLLVLDNCEHLVEACAQASDDLLRGCTGLKILASSREALGVAGEVPYHVPSMATPDPSDVPPPEALMAFDSIRLFVERAVTARPEFKLTERNAPFVAQICSQLDGIPLAIELAAARVKVLTPEQIAARLDDRFRLLTGGARTALPRQQTLRALIDWSYGLLSEEEKTLLRRLAVFAGGWTLEAAEAVCSTEENGTDVLDLLARLVDKSLVITDEVGGEARYRQLETIRQYAREKFLETDEVETIKYRHLAFYVGFAETAERQLEGRTPLVWVHRLEAEQDNLRAAMEWGLERDPTSALRIAASLPAFWTRAASLPEGFRWIQRATVRYMEEIGEAGEPTLRAKGLGGLAFVYMSLGDYVNADRVAEESVALYRQSQDKAGLAHALYVLSFPLGFTGQQPRAERAVRECIDLARSQGNAYLLVSALNLLIRNTVTTDSDTGLLEGYADEAIRIAQGAGIEWATAGAVEMKGLIAAHRKHYDEARTLLDQAIQAYRESGATFNVNITKSTLAHMEREAGNYEAALAIYRETIVAFHDVAQLGAVAHQLECFGFIALAQGQDKRALRLIGAAEALRERAGTPMMPDERVYYDGQLKLLRGRMSVEEAEKAWEAGRAMTMDQAIDFALESDSVEGG